MHTNTPIVMRCTFVGGGDFAWSYNESWYENLWFSFCPLNQTPPPHTHTQLHDACTSVRIAEMRACVTAAISRESLTIFTIAVYAYITSAYECGNVDCLITVLYIYSLYNIQTSESCWSCWVTELNHGAVERRWMTDSWRLHEQKHLNIIDFFGRYIIRHTAAVYTVVQLGSDRGVRTLEIPVQRIYCSIAVRIRNLSH